MISIVDYGLGNITAFENVYKRLGIACRSVGSADELSQANKIILPGVGAFDHAMSALNQSGMRECLDYLVLQKKVPVIGICVGMQMMAKSSDEGEHGGLGWFDAHVKKFDFSEDKSHLNPLPHMGWNNIVPEHDHPLFCGLDQEKRFYFLHSYYFSPADRSDAIAFANYGTDYACVVNKENVYGIQCHPEKSHHNGVQLLRNFAELI